MNRTLFSYPRPGVPALTRPRFGVIGCDRPLRLRPDSHSDIFFAKLALDLTGGAVTLAKVALEGEPRDAVCGFALINTSQTEEKNEQENICAAHQIALSRRHLIA